MLGRARAKVRMIGAERSRAISARIRAIEAETGVDIVVALIGRSDLFHGLRWRAFACGTVVSALAVVVADALHPDWLDAYTVLLTALAILAGGFACLFLATYVPAFERLFLQHSRAHAALNQRAKVLFLERQLFATPSRNAVLIVAGVFERVVAVLADTGYDGRIDDTGWQAIVDAASPGLSRGDFDGAFVAALDALQHLLSTHGFSGRGGANVIDDTPLELDGEA